MKRLFLILGFIVFWKQWEVPYIHVGNDPIQPEIVQEYAFFGQLLDARDFIRRHKKDERYSDIHIYEIGREIQ